MSEADEFAWASAAALLPCSDECRAVGPQVHPDDHLDSCPAAYRVRVSAAIAAEREACARVLDALAESESDSPRFNVYKSAAWAVRNRRG